jgi:hypothetical protein
VLLSKVKELIKNKSTTSYKITDDSILEGIIYEALLYVCSMCEPSELIQIGVAPNYIEVLRHIEGGKYLKAPEYPDFTKTNRHLQMDEALTYAVIYYSCFIISKMENIILKQLADEIVAVYKSNYSRGIYND